MQDVDKKRVDQVTEAVVTGKLETVEESPIEHFVGIKSLLERMRPLLSEAYLALPPRDTTVIAFETEAAPGASHGGERTFKMCCYFGKRVKLYDNGDVGDPDIKRFAHALNSMVAGGLIAHGTLGPPSVIPILDESHGKCGLLIAYVFSDFTKDQLNEMIGVPAFMEEGQLMPHYEWPTEGPLAL